MSPGGPHRSEKLDLLWQVAGFGSLAAPLTVAVDQEMPEPTASVAGLSVSWALIVATVITFVAAAAKFRFLGNYGDVDWDLLMRDADYRDRCAARTDADLTAELSDLRKYQSLRYGAKGSRARHSPWEKWEGHEFWDETATSAAGKLAVKVAETQEESRYQRTWKVLVVCAVGNLVCAVALLTPGPAEEQPAPGAPRTPSSTASESP